MAEQATKLESGISNLLYKQFDKYKKMLLDGKTKADKRDKWVWEGFEKKLEADLKNVLNIKNFKDIEKAFPRFKILEDAISKVDSHNKEYATKKRSFKLRINEFSDMSFEDYSKKMLGLRFPPNKNITKKIRKPFPTKRRPAFQPRTTGHPRLTPPPRTTPKLQSVPNFNAIKMQTTNNKFNVTNQMSLVQNRRFRRQADDAPNNGDQGQGQDQESNGVDWRKRGKVTPVRQQGDCGSCWAFAATAALEAHLNIKGQGAAILSPQNLVDCCQNVLNGFNYGGGCSGSHPTLAYEYMQEKGVNTEQDYPYEGVEGQCREKDGGVKIQEWQDIPSFDEEAMRQAIDEVGPILATLQCTFLFQYYDGRQSPDGTQVLDDWLCFPGWFSAVKEFGNHAVLIVGYASDWWHGDYWIIKNSHGTTWGDNGYFYLKRGIHACSISKNPSYPVV